MTFPKPSPPAYSAIQIWLHWGIALLIGSQFVLNGPIGKAWRALSRGQGADISSTVLLHVYVGIAVLVLVLWRLALRVCRGVPRPVQCRWRDTWGIWVHMA
jgi:cytochrome b561